MIVILRNSKKVPVFYTFTYGTVGNKYLNLMFYVEFFFKKVKKGGTSQYHLLNIGIIIIFLP